MVHLLCCKSNDALSAQNNLLKHTSQSVLLILAYMYWTLEAERKTVRTHAVMYAHQKTNKSLSDPNNNGILARLAASFLLLHTVSSDVLCLKFSGV